MLTPFPGLLDYAFFAPTLLRITAAVAVGFIAYAHYTRRNELGHIRMPIFGNMGTGMVLFMTAIEGVIALALFFGYYTQIAALLAGILCIKHMIYAKKYPRFVPLCRADYVFLLVICFSLMLTGAGALAFDLPL